MLKEKSWFVLLALALWCWPLASLAHEIRPAIVTVTFKTDGYYYVDISTNMEALLAGISPKHSDTKESPNARSYDALRAMAAAELKKRIENFGERYLAGITLEFDGVRARPALQAVTVPESGDTALVRLTTLRLVGTLPPAAEEFRWAYAAEFGASVLRIQKEGVAGLAAFWIKEGDRSEVYRLHAVADPVSRSQVAKQYTLLGFSHILPKGLDHILFVLGLFLLSAKWKPLLIQVTFFTVAHTITLGLSIYGIISLSPAIVEPLISASIVYVAVENMVTAELKPWRVFVVFGFGLLHGMGFAGVLAEIGLPRSEFVTALLTFNLGVEFGQLAVIVAAYLLIGRWWKEKSWYRARLVQPLSALIAVTGGYWTVARIFA